MTLASYLLNPGEERIVGWRLAEVSGAASAKSASAFPKGFSRTFWNVKRAGFTAVEPGESTTMIFAETGSYAAAARPFLSRPGSSGARDRCPG